MGRPYVMDNDKLARSFDMSGAAACTQILYLHACVALLVALGVISPKAPTREKKKQ